MNNQPSEGLWSRMKRHSASRNIMSLLVLFLLDMQLAKAHVHAAFMLVQKMEPATSLPPPYI